LPEITALAPATARSIQDWVVDVKQLQRELPDLISTDEYAVCQGAILEMFGEEVVPPRRGLASRTR
jgi:hypothetical protein